MKCTIILLLLSISCFSQAQRSAPLQATIDRFYISMVEAAPEKMRKVVTNDFLMLEDGVPWTIDSVMKAMAPVKGTDFQIKDSIRYIRVDQRKNTATVVFWHDAQVFVRGKWQTVGYLESAFFRKQDAVWKIALLHVTHLIPFQK